MRGKALFEDFYKAYKDKLKDSKYKYLAYRKTEDAHKLQFGERRFKSFDSFRLTIRRLKNK